MALFRQVARAPNLIRQCGRVFATQQQHVRGYADMPLTLASPTEVFFKEVSVKQIDVPTLDSAVGILPNHVPTLAVLKPGVVNVVVNDTESRKIFVSSGSLTVNPDGSVQILAEEAVDIQSIDPQAVRDGLANAQSASSTASTEKEKGENMVELQCYEALLKAIE